MPKHTNQSNKRQYLSWLNICFWLLLTPTLAAANCPDIVRFHNDKQILTAKVLENKQPLYSVIVCRDEEKPVYKEFYAYIHLDKHQYGIPKSGLSSVEQPFKSQNKTTGVLTAGPQQKNSYTLKFRTRFENGDFIDVAETFTLLPGKATTFSKEGYVVGIVRAPQV